MEQSMKFSARTLEVLKNFSTINSSIYIRAGNEIRTTTTGGDIFAIATVPDSFPKNFAIYELNRFLGALSLQKEPNVTFGDRSLTIASGKSKVRYVYASENLIVKPNEGQPKLTKLTSFMMPQTVLSEMTKAAGVLGLPDISIDASNGYVNLVVHNKKEDSSDNHVTTMGECDPNFNFRVDINVDKLKLIPSEYMVEIGQTKNGHVVVLFESSYVSYYIAAEASTVLDR